MDRLRQMLRRRSAKVVSVGAERSRGLGQEDLGRACHDDEGPIKARRWLCPICCRRKLAAPDSRRKEDGKPTTSRTRWRWPWVRLSKQEPAPEQCQAQELRSSPPVASRGLEPDPAGPQQEAAPCTAWDEGPSSLGQELSELSTSPSLSCGSSWDDSHSSLESGTTSPSRGSSSGDSNSSPESRNTSPSPSSSSGDSDSCLESQNTSSSSSSSEEDAHSSLESGTTPAPGASHTVIPSLATDQDEDQDEDEDEDEEDGRPPEQAALLLVTKHLQEPGKTLEGKEGKRFLLAILTLSAVAEQSTEVAMELEGLKVSVVEKIVDMMENISGEADRRNILAYSIDAIRSLSELKLSLEPGLESRLLRAAIEKSFLAIGHESHRNQVMQRLYVEYLQGLLCRFLFSAPSLGKLYSIWEHFTFWMETPDAQSRALGMKIVTGVLAFAVQLLPQFEASPELPEVGDMAACLGLSINDPVESTSCYARGSVYWLAQILLHQRGQDMRGAEELRCKRQAEQSQVQNYRDLARVGEGWSKILLEEQKRSFLQRVLAAVHGVQTHVSQAGLVFLYSILGEAGRLIGHKEKQIPVRVVSKLLLIKCFKELPEELQGHSLLASSSATPSALQQPTLAPAAGNHLDPENISLTEHDLQNLTGSLAATEEVCNSAEATTEATD
ncbi:uncharacterized protein LOC132249419 [Alligator mississippiensis]|uniref:uncharacterized protein LOC132249419 n=1 Tax=Alligator mississippiensis TaxID=8496 RepID=UPI002877D60C|nr:uncharacterized protein LOC132249419 [Alligator mississippiensis]